MWDFVIFSTLSDPCCTLLAVGDFYSFHRSFQRLFSLGGMLSRLLFVLDVLPRSNTTFFKRLCVRKIRKGLPLFYGNVANPNLVRGAVKCGSPFLRGMDAVGVSR